MAQVTTFFEPGESLLGGTAAASGGHSTGVIAQLRVCSLEDFAHPTFADLLDDVVMEKLLTRLEGTHLGAASMTGWPAVAGLGDVQL